MRIIEQQTFSDSALDIVVHSFLTETGLRIMVAPLPQYATTYALYGTRYGSIDTRFKTEDESEFADVPEGIAHYLEHKLFESEDVSAFARFAETGAQANAYTSFDRTCYLFACTANAEKNLEILLDFVSSPYFTEENVEKERGIIGQEIRMYDDDAGWCVLFNLLRALYSRHPVRIDIAGTVESIEKIDADLLYRCYNTFYNQNNMFLCVAGGVTPEEVLAAVDNALKVTEPVTVCRGSFDEPQGIVQSRVTQALAVGVPKFAIGFKEKASGMVSAEREAAMSVLLNMIVGDDSDLYNEMFAQGLINDSFGCEYFTGFDFASVIFEGESSDPDRVYEKIKEHIAMLHERGLNKEDFERSRRKCYGRAVMGAYSDVSEIASRMVDCAMSGSDMLADIKALRELEFARVQAMFDEGFDIARSAISIVVPSEK